MTSHFPNYPHLYDPPGDVVRALRDVDPAADLLYGGWGTWMLVRFKPNRDHIARACAALSGRSDQHGKHVYGAIELLDLWHELPRFKANPGAYRRLYQRFLYWTAIRLGARPIMQYNRQYIRALGFSAIVTDFRQAEWKLRHTSDNDLQRALDEPKDTARAEARKGLTDEHAAVTMAKHLAANPHSVTARAPEVVSAAVTRTSATTLARSA